MHTWQKILATLPLILSALGLAFRHTIYVKIPVAQGEPYGLGDIIDGLFFLLMFMAASVVVLAGIVSLIRREKRAGVVMIACAVIAYAGYRALHTVHFG